MPNLKEIIKFMSEGHDYWQPKGIVDIELTDERKNEYPNHETCRVKNDDNDRELYIKCHAEELMDGTRPVKWYYVVQWSGYMGDDYSGFLLIPYGKQFLKVSYSC